MSKVITDINQLDLKKQYSYSDYLNWQFNERVELIKGWIFKMCPAPRRVHQKISLKLTISLASFFNNCNCEVYEAPFDVRLKRNKGSDKEVDTVVQPDISVFCDLTKLDDRGAVDAPELVIEITSDSTLKRDYNDKFRLYEENGVQEYWIVNPEMKSMELFFNQNCAFESMGIYNISDGAFEISSCLFPDLKVDLVEVFKD